MAIDSPTTYGEYYWKAQLDARKLYDDDVEDVLSGYISDMFNSLDIADVLPSAFGSYVHAMTSKSSFAWSGILARFGSEMADSILSQTMGHALKDFNYSMADKFQDLRITAPQASILYRRKKIDEPFFLSRMHSEGLKDAEAAAFYGSLFPYPAIADIMRYARYHGDPVNTRADVWKKFDVPADDYDMYEWLTLQLLNTDQIHRLLRRGKISQPDADFFFQRVGWRDESVGFISELGWSIPNPMLLTQGNLQQRKEAEQIIGDIIKADIHPDYAQTYLDAILTKPASADVIAYELRQDPELTRLDEQLRKIGIHPEYFGVYKELAHVIPPVPDIITMAVREAFTPEIAAKFGQYEDFPPDFADWAAKKGLTTEWSQRYWAAHWALPSPIQGFTMLHRGVIDSSELDLLLRAQDVMPFWRQKLTQIAYRPLTRVDVRRMYRQGVLDVKEVYEAYLDQGYADENAERMTEFTVKQALSIMAKFTSRDVITAFTKRMIDTSTACSLLVDLGIKSADISYILSRAEYKRKWDLTDSKIAGIKNLYKRAVYDENKTRAELLALNLPSDEVDVLFEQWWYEKKADVPPTWTKAETLRFAKAELITPGRARRELKLMEYDVEHVEVYMEGIE